MSTAGARPRHAIILAGGASTRLGADKPEQRVGGRRLLDIAVAAVADADAVVMVGPPREVPAGVTVVREDPPGSGPVAALGAGFAALPEAAADVVVLAADLPRITAEAVDTLAAARGDAPVALAIDDHDRPQYLTAVWDSRALQVALTAAPSRMRELLPHNAIGIRVADIVDVDTPEQLAAARSHADRSPDGVRSAVRSAIRPLPAVERGLDAAVGGVLAESLVAVAPFPPFDASAMDGWAVAGPGPWIPQDSAIAAGMHGATLAAGHACRIATGARLPMGAQRVIRDEEIDATPGSVRQRDTGPAGRDDTRRCGSEWPIGTVLASACTRVDDALASLARSAGVDRLVVRGPVRVTVHSSGDEIGVGTSTLDAGKPQLPETATGPVAARLRSFGAVVDIGRHLSDDPSALAAALAGDTDLVVIIGATGRGVADHLRAAISNVGGVIVADGVAMRPGGSVLVAVLPEAAARARVLLGVGGNPLAAVAGTAVLGPVIVESLTAAKPAALDLIPVRDLPRTDRWRVVPVEPDGSGAWIAAKHTATAHLAALVGRRALALVPPDCPESALVERLS
ncbi:NTP transferase domain-containing protein [Mycobacterium paraterrae]|uniref:Molybdopterin molybdenumtransferase n=1 Tax=Mycobacterium paraterrae TaxID=577492 RepID=A0ABY3VK54_9MYCO|nr:NTP transferase domain-containing protein [Mycobacterium paraterrae]UMB67530.1 NTP transferase domain-containing protein [Mycobacterium paraterrae]